MDPKPFHLKSLFLIIGLIVLAVLVVIILQQQQQLRTLKNSNQSQTNTNTSQVKSEDQSQAPISGERETISAPYSALTGNCDIKTNTDAANTTAKFSDKTLGFEVELPYNQKWGTDKYKVDSYEFNQKDNILSFGPIGAGEGCGWSRRYGMQIGAPMTDAQVIAQIKKDNNSTDITFGPEVVSVDGLKMIRYQIGGICTFPKITVLGKRHTYTFSAGCSDDRSATFKLYNDIIATLKSI